MKQSLILLAILVTAACAFRDPANSSDLVSAQASLSNDSVLTKMKTYCYPCHNPAAPNHDAIIAPPLAAVKIRYSWQYKSPQEFDRAMVDFLLNPAEEKAIMYGAVDRFGVMGKTAADEQTLRRIVSYIRQNQLETPAWYRAGMP